MSYDAGKRWVERHADYFSRSHLKRRGWTSELMRAHLQAPDLTVENPHDPSGAAACLYRRSRVLEIEASAEFQADLAQRGRQGAAEQR